MSAEEVQSKYPTIERLADLSNTTVGYQVNVLVLEAVACFRELAQAKAELSALSRASGEAVAWGIVAANTGDICEVTLDPGDIDDLPEKYIRPLYAAPTAPGMVLVPEEPTEAVIELMVRHPSLESALADIHNDAEREWRGTTNGDTYEAFARRRAAQVYRAIIAAAKGRAAT